MALHRDGAKRSILAVFLLADLVCSAPAPAIASDTAADRVLGQVSFAYATANLVDDRGVRSPAAVAIDRSVTPNRIYVADSLNNRVLAWVDVTSFANGAPADLLIGQPDSDSVGCNTGGVSADSLCDPRGIAVDATGNLYVADSDNNRILQYDTPFASDLSADRVFGQSGSFTTGVCNDGGVSATSLCDPHGLAFDGADDLYVSDYGNNRVLEYDTPLATDLSADRVFGQGGSFATVSCNGGGVSASTLCRPYGLRLDGTGNLYVADQSNNRVLEYDTPLVSGTTADRVFGQSGSFTGNFCDGIPGNEGAIGVASASSLCNPTDVAVDGAGNVFIADCNNSRVLAYDTPLASGTTADRVFGQAGSFTSDFCNINLFSGASASSLCNPTGVVVDAAGDLYVADTSNHRVLKYNAPMGSNLFNIATTADRVLGQMTMAANGSNMVDARGVFSPADVAIDHSVTPRRLYVADFENSRVLAWADADAFTTGGPADLVIGQPNFFSSGCNTNGRSASTLCKPIGVAVDAAGNVYVADYNNRRVLEYDTPFASGTVADRVYGRGGSFTAQAPSCGTSTISADSICNPGGVVVDQAGNLYVADPEYDRVLAYDAPLIDTIADRVFGQGGSFTSQGCNTGGLSASSLCVPRDVEVDGAGNLYISDSFNHRLLVYAAPLATDTAADYVIGQAGSFTTNACNPGGVSADGLCYPDGIAVDETGNLYVADRNNERVLAYDVPLATDATADRVFGQSGGFTTSACNLGGVSADSLCDPSGVAVDDAGNLYVADSDNNRVLAYDTPIVCGNGELDPGEECEDGNSGAGDCCVACRFEPAGTPCRASAGVCDAPETCTGASGACPADAFAPATTECRVSTGECDPAESCTGNGPACPAESRASAGTACTADGNPCTVDQCDGANAACQHPAGNAGAVCRTSADVCDVDDACDGTSAICPADAFAPSGTLCRAAAGACDTAESCTGTGATCPADALQPSGTLCRAAADVCDAVEHCTGSGATCPLDGFEPATTICRPASGICDLDESCTGASASCPADDVQADGTPCDDTNACTTLDACESGTCVGAVNPTCSDHYLCYTANTGGAVLPSAAHLVDAFEDVTTTIRSPKLLCAAADKNGEGVIDPNTHERAYRFKQTPSHRRRIVTTSDQFGTLSLTTTRADLLFVPTALDLASLPSPPDLGAINVNHYKCYRVKTNAAIPPLPRGVQVLVRDQLTPSQKRFDVRKPRHLCTPVDKNGEGIRNPGAALVCYQVKPAKGEVRHVSQAVFIDNQFSPETVRTLKEREICVPSVITP